MTGLVCAFVTQLETTDQAVTQLDTTDQAVTLPGVSDLVLSLFPGAGLLDKGFEAAGYCVVRGPDKMLGQDVRGFRVPAGVFQGVIGGPPCQDYSRARRRPPTGYGDQMLREYLRIVHGAAPAWFVMENVPGVPSVSLPGYTVQRVSVDAREFGGSQRRLRVFQFGYVTGGPVVLRRDTVRFSRQVATVLARDQRFHFTRLCRLQGLPGSLKLPGLSLGAKIRAVGNGVPVQVATALAVAIRGRWEQPAGKVCECGCGREVRDDARCASSTCRKRCERKRKCVGSVARVVELC